MRSSNCSALLFGVMKRFLYLFGLVIVLAAFLVPSAFCLADTEADVQSVHDIVLQLGQVDNYAIPSVFAWLSEADRLLADAAVDAAVPAEDKAALETYRLYYHRDNCLLELDKRMGDHTFALGGGREDTYLEPEWTQILAWVAAYRDAIGGYTAAEMRTNLDALYANVATLDSRQDVYNTWCDRVDEVVAEANGALADHVNLLRGAVGLHPLSVPAFDVRTAADSLAAWDGWVAAYTTDYSALQSAYHSALTATLATAPTATDAQRPDVDAMRALWQDYYPLVQSLSGIVVPVADADVVAAKAQLQAYITNALATPPLSTLEGEARQYYLDLAARCQQDLQGATTPEEVQRVADYYTAKFTVQSPAKNRNTRMWVLVGISMGVAAACFVVYFLLKRRSVTPKQTHQSAERFLAELQAIQPAAPDEAQADGTVGDPAEDDVVGEALDGGMTAEGDDPTDAVPDGDAPQGVIDDADFGSAPAEDAPKEDAPKEDAPKEDVPDEAQGSEPPATDADGEVPHD